MLKFPFLGGSDAEEHGRRAVRALSVRERVSQAVVQFYSVFELSAECPSCLALVEDGFGVYVYSSRSVSGERGV